MWPHKRNGGVVAHLVRDEGVAGSNPATPTSFLVAPIRLRGQLCGTKHTSDNLAPPIPIHSAPSGGGAGVGIWKRCQMSIANCTDAAKRAWCGVGRPRTVPRARPRRISAPPKADMRGLDRGAGFGPQLQARWSDPQWAAAASFCDMNFTIIGCGSRSDADRNLISSLYFINHASCIAHSPTGP
jgi:hypothetical protein